MLRNPWLRIDDLIYNFVVQLSERRLDDMKRPPLIMRHEVLNILQHECFRPPILDDTSDIEEQGPLGLIKKPVFSAHTLLLHDTSQTKRLTWKSTQKHIMNRNFSGRNFRDVPSNVVVQPKISPIGRLSKFVPLAAKNAFSTYLFEGHPETANPGKKINKPECSRC